MPTVPERPIQGHLKRAPPPATGPVAELTCQNLVAQCEATPRTPDVATGRGRGTRRRPTMPPNRGSSSGRSKMPTVLILHEVEDVDHWLKSPKREEVFGPAGYTLRTFVDPNDPHTVGLIFEGPGLEKLQEM